MHACMPPGLCVNQLQIHRSNAHYAVAVAYYPPKRAFDESVTVQRHCVSYVMGYTADIECFAVWMGVTGTFFCHLNCMYGMIQNTSVLWQNR